MKLSLWIDTCPLPPKVLMLVEDNGVFSIKDIVNQHKIIVTFDNYEAARDWLIEDEFEQIELIAKT